MQRGVTGFPDTHGLPSPTPQFPFWNSAHNFFTYSLDSALRYI
jgi:hypothetical protein